jgi:hypothetical protein
MKLLSAPRQPFIGLTLMAVTGIVASEVVPVRSTVLIPTAIVLAICILIALCWPKFASTYLIVAAGFFLLHKFAIMVSRLEQGGRKRAELAAGENFHLSRDAIAHVLFPPRGFAGATADDQALRSTPFAAFWSS